MEYCKGGDLFGFIEKRGPCSKSDYPLYLKLVKDIASGLQAIHKKNFIHRDIKPGNIFLQKVGELLVAKVADLDHSREVP